MMTPSASLSVRTGPSCGDGLRTLSPQEGGASLWVQAPAWADADEPALTARSHGVLIEPGDVFFAKPPYPCPFFRLRLSSIAKGNVVTGQRALTLAVQELAHGCGVTTTSLPTRPH